MGHVLQERQITLHEAELQGWLCLELLASLLALGACFTIKTLGQENKR